MSVTPRQARRLTQAFTALGSVGLLGAASVAAAAPPSVVDDYQRAHASDVLRNFETFLSIPNFALDQPNIRRNANYLVDELVRRGFETRLLETAGAPPAVLAVLRTPGASLTVGIYAHYDGQPVKEAEWTSPPFSPVVREAPTQHAAVSGATQPAGASPDLRIYARSASDDKGAIEAILVALDALRAGGRSVSVDLKLFFEGEEEVGSPHLEKSFEHNRDALRADLWLLCDGPVHQSGLPQLFFGARGVVTADVTVYGPDHPLHSGHYGNWAPNPIVRLTHLIDSLRDEEARILIPGFYDSAKPPTAEEDAAIRAAPEVDAEIRSRIGVATTEAYPRLLARSILEPALNVIGFQSGEVGSRAPSAIPAEAKAAIEFRLVPDQRPEQIQQLLERYVERLHYRVIRADPTPAERLEAARLVKITWSKGYPGARTSLADPYAIAVRQIVGRALSTSVVVVPSLGGSIPMYLFSGGDPPVPIVGVPIANYDNNQHAADENLRVDFLWRGARMFAALLTELGTAGVTAAAPAAAAARMARGARPKSTSSASNPFSQRSSTRRRPGRPHGKIFAKSIVASAASASATAIDDKVLVHLGISACEDSLADRGLTGRETEIPYFKPFAVADERANKPFGGRAQAFARRCTRTMQTVPKPGLTYTHGRELLASRPPAIRAR